MECEIKEIRMAIFEFLWHCRFEKSLNEKIEFLSQILPC